MLSLKEIAYVLEYCENKSSKFVTLLVSHVEMWPYVASADAGHLSHFATADFMLLLVIT